MDKHPVPDLQLTITNTAGLGRGFRKAHAFGAEGGSIGSAQNDSWQLSSHRTGVVAGHAEVRVIDGAFCLIDRCGRTYVNGGQHPVGRGRRARLKDGDEIVIGRYHLRAALNGAMGEGTLDLDTGAPADDSLVAGDEAELWRGRDGDTTAHGPKEPLAELRSAPAEPVSDDPLEGFRDTGSESGEEEQDRILASPTHWQGEAASVTDECRDNRDVALGLPVQQGDLDRMSKQPPNRPAGEPSPEQRSRRHISGAPLLRGMETELEFADSDDMRLFLEEAGQTLKATVEGLLALHQHEDSRHRALRTRLQPIEDNPLRLGQPYDDAVQTLFASQRSPVHLSAPAAVRESLDSLRQHQQATQAATAEALEAILQALSPAALLRRFHGYRRGLQRGENEDAWAWQMYQHYYRELSSRRQQGFERLFQEVFEQAYDQHLRQLQRESLT
ncbi:MAG: type VI secretion system-associated FHA domain protein TagH [Marinobacter sp.]|uniref:type VI secretion system-associated FHA domain protein TagH n=1 Tax=Marinobacter sp. TaxID=50741 RepID=UPI00299DE483|nr:type VI secretion system-associated FHA domain protein TagH [Marinobacter sp.]MDX1756885.1 type VI secretion system-associated FHA domain protein TagH [Marinobacter sp.]